MTDRGRVPLVEDNDDHADLVRVMLPPIARSRMVDRSGGLAR
jgi:hypothetical protein